MAEASTLAVTARDRAGKGAARAERRAGRIPAVIYGGKEDPVLISVEPKSLLDAVGIGCSDDTKADVVKRAWG